MAAGKFPHITVYNIKARRKDDIDPNGHDHRLYVLVKNPHRGKGGNYDNTACDNEEDNKVLLYIGFV
jgi:hypothetical protein